MVSTFGPNIRGISPYADNLAEALNKYELIKLKQVDYKSPFPSFLLPKGTNYKADNSFASVNYKNPKTWRLDKDSNWDIVHLQYWSPAFLPILLILINRIKNKTTKVIITWHNPKPHESIPLIKFIENIIAKMADGIIFHNNNYMLDRARAETKKKCTIIHHGCNIEDTNHASSKDYQRCSLKDDRQYILFFGNIRPYKGLEYLIDAWQLIKHKFPDVDLIIAGKLWEHNDSVLSKIVNKVAKTTNYSDKIRGVLSKNDNKQVLTDFEFIEEEKLISYIKISKLAIFPYSEFESQSGAAMKAISNKTPIITTNIGGLTELVIDNSYVSQSCSSVSLANTIENSLTNYNVELRALQFNKAKEYSWDSAATKHIKFYNQIIDV